MKNRLLFISSILLLTLACTACGSSHKTSEAAGEGQTTTVEAAAEGTDEAAAEKEDAESAAADSEDADSAAPDSEDVASETPVDEASESASAADDDETAGFEEPLDPDFLIDTEAAAHPNRFEFETVDINGSTITTADLADAKVVMINFWEPWCGPCVAELPEIQQLYENYKDQGLLILGVYSSFDQDEDVQAMMEQNGISYPILKYVSAFDAFQTGYVPSTYFADSEGKVISTEEYIGSHSYSEWEKILGKYLN